MQPNSLRFWIFRKGPGFFNRHYVPATMSYSDMGLVCTYIPKGRQQPAGLFQLSWDEIGGRYYNPGGKAFDTLSIIGKDGQVFTFSRYLNFRSNKKFPQILVDMAPSDTEFTNRSAYKPSKGLVEIEDLLKAKNIPIQKPGHA